MVPSAATFGDALHCARLAEEHTKQILEIHKNREEKGFPKKQVVAESSKKKPVAEVPFKMPGRGCFRCGSQCHRARECPQRKPPGKSLGKPPATISIVTAEGGGESLDTKCMRLHKEMAAAEHQRLLGSCESGACVDMVSG